MSLLHQSERTHPWTIQRAKPELFHAAIWKCMGRRLGSSRVFHQGPFNAKDMDETCQVTGPSPSNLLLSRVFSKQIRQDPMLCRNNKNSSVLIFDRATSSLTVPHEALPPRCYAVSWTRDAPPAALTLPLSSLAGYRRSCPASRPDGRCSRRGKSGLHGETAPDNVRRG